MGVPDGISARACAQDLCDILRRHFERIAFEQSPGSGFVMSTSRLVFLIVFWKYGAVATVARTSRASFVSTVDRREFGSPTVRDFGSGLAVYRYGAKKGKHRSAFRL